jgi:SAM-dependent methyltransferase
VDLKITPEIVKRFNDKDSKKAHFRELYEKHDFLTAYAKHTDLRVADNPLGAIGREDEWESHGREQFKFLIHEGLHCWQRFLDIGCGVGRLARVLVPWLEEGCYTGVDISPAALEHAKTLSVAEGWVVKQPRFLLNGALDIDGTFDMLWAHSVFTHLPPQQVEVMIGNAARHLMPGHKFLFTYKQARQAQRSGLKQFQYPPSFFATLAGRYGFKSEPLNYVFPAHQNTMRLTRLFDEVTE